MGSQTLAYRVVHSVPGRVRLRVPRLRDNELLGDCLHWYLQQETGVVNVRLARACDSVVIEFEPRLFDPNRCLDGLTEEILFSQDIRLEDQAQRRLQDNSLYRLVMQTEQLFSPVVQMALGGLSLGAAVFGWPAAVSRLVMVAAVVPIVNRAARTALEEKRLGADALDTIGCSLLLVEGHYLPVGVMTFLISLGELIREFAIARCQRILDYLQGLEEQSAWITAGDSRVKVPAHQVNLSDIVVVYTGESVPVSGIVVEGSGTVAAAVGRHEWLTKDVGAGAAVFRDNVLLSGKVFVRASETVAPPVVSSMEARIKRRALYRTNFQVQALAKGYRVVSPVLFVTALLFFMRRNHASALALLCFDFLTAVRIAVPTAILSSLYRSGRSGVLVKNAAVMERLSQIDVLVFARTGVLTAGNATVVEVIPLCEIANLELVRLTAAAVDRYHHPAARAIANYAAQQSIIIPDRSSSEIDEGFGVCAQVEGRTVVVGSRRFLENRGIDTGAAESVAFYVTSRGDSLSYIAFDGTLAGVIAYRDPVRPESSAVIDKLRQLGVNHIVVTSGDTAAVLRRSTENLAIDRIYPELSPEDKAALVRDFQMRGLNVAVVGDDISDASALAQADVAVSLRHSMAVARCRSDVILTGDSLDCFVQGIEIARQGMNLARRNLFLVSMSNWTMLFLSLAGRLGPIQGTLLNNGTVIYGALNGLTPLLSTNLRQPAPSLPS